MADVFLRTHKLNFAYLRSALARYESQKERHQQLVGQGIELMGLIKYKDKAFSFGKDVLEGLSKTSNIVLQTHIGVVGH